METLHLSSHLPRPLQRVHIAHFPVSPSQSDSILTRILACSKLPPDASSSAAERAALDLAFLDASRLISRAHLESAILYAATVCARSWTGTAFDPAAVPGGMKTKTVHSEVVFALSPGNNVGEAFRRFGLSKQTETLVLVKFTAPDVEPQAVVSTMVDVVRRSDPARPGAVPVPLVGLDPRTGGEAGHGGSDAVWRSVRTDWRTIDRVYRLGMPRELLERVEGREEEEEEGEVSKRLERYEAVVCSAVALKGVVA